MPEPRSSAIDHILNSHSIASVRNWLRNKGLAHSAGTKVELRKRVEGLVEKGSLTSEAVTDGAIGIEEASSKRTFLFRIAVAPRNLSAIDTQLASLQIQLSDRRVPSSSPKAKPKLVYAINSPTEFRAKWNELHTKTLFDKKAKTFDDKPVPKVVICIVSKESGLVQLRCDAPEDHHIHTEEGVSTDKAYFAYYKAQVESMLGQSLEPIDLRNGLERILRSQPRIVKVAYVVDETSEGGVNKRSQKQRHRDVRDLSDFPAENGSHGVIRIFSEAPLYWLPEMSQGDLKREVYSYVDASKNLVRFQADCYEEEIAHVLSKLVSA